MRANRRGGQAFISETPKTGAPLGFRACRLDGGVCRRVGVTFRRDGSPCRRADMTCRPGDMTCLRGGVRCCPADLTCLRADMAIRRDGKEAFPPCKDIPLNRRRSLNWRLSEEALGSPVREPLGVLGRIQIGTTYTSFFSGWNQKKLLTDPCNDKTRLND